MASGELPYKLLRKKWQYLLLTAIGGQAVSADRQVDQRGEEAKLISQLFENYKEGFYVNAASRMEEVQGAARYIGRYLARPAIAEYRITRYDGQQVTFWYEDHESEQRQTKTMKVEAFIERLIAHIAPKQSKLVRRFGLYARRAKGKLPQAMAACRRAIQWAFDFFHQESKPVSWRQRLIKSYGTDPLLCPHCGTELELYRLWHPRYGFIPACLPDRQACPAGRPVRQAGMIWYEMPPRSKKISPNHLIQRSRSVIVSLYCLRVEV